MNDFEKYLEENRQFLLTSPDDYRCVLHHIKDGYNIEQIKDYSENGHLHSLDFITLYDILSELAQRVIINHTLGCTYSLSEYGKRLVKEIPDPNDR